MNQVPRTAAKASGVIRSGKLAPLSERLKKLGLVTDWDFILHLPLRYEDETKIDPIGMLIPGEPVQVQGEVVRSQMTATPWGQQLIALLKDETGILALRFIHYFPGTQAQLRPGSVVRVYGEPRPAFGGGLEMIHPKSGSRLRAALRFPKPLRRSTRSEKAFSRSGSESASRERSSTCREWRTLFLHPLRKRFISPVSGLQSNTSTIRRRMPTLKHFSIERIPIGSGSNSTNSLRSRSRCAKCARLPEKKGLRRSEHRQAAA